jgi:hypothetical protein
LLTAQRLGVGVLSERYPCGTGRRVRIPAAWCDDPHSKYAQFDGRPVRDFVPLFVERYARAELAKLAA